MSYVYLIHAEGTKRYKIGFSNDVPQRMRELQTSSPVDLSLIMARCGSREMEKRLHARFAEFRKCGEWFEFDDLSPVLAEFGFTAFQAVAAMPIQDTISPIKKELPDILTDKDLAEYLNFSAMSLWRFRRSGLLPFRRVGGQIRYTRADVDMFLDRQARNLT